MIPIDKREVVAVPHRRQDPEQVGRQHGIDVPQHR
jgi:hypothetical protein